MDAATYTGGSDVSIYDNKHCLIEEMKLLASLPEFCDIIFEIGEAKLPVCAIKSVLGARSRVFRRSLFRSPSPLKKRDSFMKENKLRLFLKRSSEPLINLHNAVQQPQCSRNDFLSVEEFEADDFRDLTEYIHTGSVYLHPRTLLGVLNAADYYSVDELRHACVEFVQCCISVDTVCALLASAEKYIQYKCTKSLVQKVLEFVDEHGNEVLNLGSFTLLPQHVVRLILARDELKADEYTKFQAALIWGTKYVEANPNTTLQNVMRDFVDHIHFSNIPVDVLMNEINELRLMPHDVVVAAVVSKVNLLKAESGSSNQGDVQPPPPPEESAAEKPEEGKSIITVHIPMDKDPCKSEISTENRNVSSSSSEVTSKNDQKEKNSSDEHLISVGSGNNGKENKDIFSSTSSSECSCSCEESSFEDIMSSESTTRTGSSTDKDHSEEETRAKRKVPKFTRKERICKTSSSSENDQGEFSPGSRSLDESKLSWARSSKNISILSPRHSKSSEEEEFEKGAVLPQGKVSPTLQDKRVSLARKDGVKGESSEDEDVSKDREDSLPPPDFEENYLIAQSDILRQASKEYDRRMQKHKKGQRKLRREQNFDEGSSLDFPDFEMWVVKLLGPSWRKSLECDFETQAPVIPRIVTDDNVEIRPFGDLTYEQPMLEVGIQTSFEFNVKSEEVEEVEETVVTADDEKSAEEAKVEAEEGAKALDEEASASMNEREKEVYEKMRGLIIEEYLLQSQESLRDFDVNTAKTLVETDDKKKLIKQDSMKEMRRLLEKKWLENSDSKAASKESKKEKRRTSEEGSSRTGKLKDMQSRSLSFDEEILI